MWIFETKSEVLNDSEQTMLALWRRAFPDWEPRLGLKAQETVLGAFRGNYSDYEANDAPYHDLEHTLRVGVCYMQLVEKNQQHALFSNLTPEMAQLGWIAILFHDTGYLKERGDDDGSGAKYSFVHVDRSQQFAANWMSQMGMDLQSIQRVQTLIKCTEFNPQTTKPHFEDEEHRFAGCLVGTSDWLGQMAVPDYLIKLPLLHQEMIEAKHFSPSTPAPIVVPKSSKELIQMTPQFFEKLVKPKLEGEFEGVYRLLNDPYPDGVNRYLDRIQSHLNNILQNG